MNIDVSNLKAKTQEAIQKGKERLAAEARAEEANRLALVAEMRAKADAILADIPVKCEAAAAKGENSILVMKEERYGYYKNEFIDRGNGKRWTADIINGHGLIVIDECAKANLTVDVRSCDDGCGMKGWAEVWVSW